MNEIKALFMEEACSRLRTLANPYCPISRFNYRFEPMVTCWLVAVFTCLLLGGSWGQESDPDLDDHPQFAHAMAVETRQVNGVPAVFQYGEIRPDFESVEGNAWRTRLDLDGEWELRFEGDEEVRKIVVPHSWAAMEGSKFWDIDDFSSANPARFNGAGWYRRTFSCSKKEGRRYRLEFRGVRERARVWLNDKQVAMHEGLGAPFSIDVTDALVSGENTLKVKVLRFASYRQKEDGSWDEIEGIHTPYPKAPDYWPYAGITGSVALWEEGETSIRKVQVCTQGDQFSARVFLANVSDKGFEGELSLQSPVFAEPPSSIEFSLAAGAVEMHEFRGTLSEKTIRWSPNTPQLYRLESQLLVDGSTVDSCELSFGLRDFRVSKEQLLLNDEPIFLKGVAAYNETEKGVAVTRAENTAILKRAQDAGANFVRLPVRQRDPMVYQLADKMGLMLTGEWGGFWYKEKSMAAQTEDEHSIYQSMGRVAVWDLMNRPSVVLWCTNNECHQFGPEFESFVKMNHTLVHELDEEMLPITWAAWHPHQGQPRFEWADVVGFNEYRGAMDSFEELAPDMEMVRKQNPEKPIVILENGSWSRLGKRGAKEKRGTEDWQADLIRRQWEVLSQHTPQLAGYTFWTLQDYRSRKTYTGHRGANGWSRMGMYDFRGRSKLAREAFQQIVPSNP